MNEKILFFMTIVLSLNTSLSLVSFFTIVYLIGHYRKRKETINFLLDFFEKKKLDFENLEKENKELISRLKKENKEKNRLVKKLHDIKYGSFVDRKTNEEFSFDVEITDNIIEKFIQLEKSITNLENEINKTRIIFGNKYLPKKLALVIKEFSKRLFKII